MMSGYTLYICMMTTCATVEGKPPSNLYHRGKKRRAPRKLPPLLLLLCFSLPQSPLSSLLLLFPLHFVSPHLASPSLPGNSAWAWLPGCSDGNKSWLFWTSWWGGKVKEMMNLLAKVQKCKIVKVIPRSNRWLSLAGENRFIAGRDLYILLIKEERGDRVREKVKVL